MRVDPTTHAAQQASSGVRPTSRSASGGSTFAAALARASSTESSNSTDSELKSKRGEPLREVKGHRYARILEGERKGQFINMSGNEREGKAFERVRRDGREWHVYGTGAHRVVVEVKHRADTDTSTTTNTSSSSGSGSSESASSSSSGGVSAPQS